MQLLDVGLKTPFSLSMQNGFQGSLEEFEEITREYSDYLQTHRIVQEGNLVFVRSIKSEQIRRGISKNLQALRQQMVKDQVVKANLDHSWDYSLEIQKVVWAFQEYMKACWRNPLYNKISIKTKNGEEIVYSRLNNRFQSNRNVLAVLEKFHNLKRNIPAVFLTLTYNRKSSLSDTWKNVAKDWNRFWTRVKAERKKIGLGSDFQYLYVLEAQSDGYVHLHALIFGDDLLNKQGKVWLWENGDYSDIEEAQSPRSDLKTLESFWKQGFTYVNGVKKNGEIMSPVGYMFKYLLKTYYYSEGSDYTSSEKKKDLLGKSMLWLYRKRSFNRSRGLITFLQKNQDNTFDIEIEEKGEGKQISVDFWSYRKDKFFREKVAVKKEKIPDDPNFGRIYTKNDLEELEQEYVVNGFLSPQKKWALEYLYRHPDGEIVIYRKISIPEEYVEYRKIKRILSTSEENT